MSPARLLVSLPGDTQNVLTSIAGSSPASLTLACPCGRTEDSKSSRQGSTPWWVALEGQADSRRRHLSRTQASVKALRVRPPHLPLVPSRRISCQESTNWAQTSAQVRIRYERVAQLVEHWYETPAHKPPAHALSPTRGLALCLQAAQVRVLPLSLRWPSATWKSHGIVVELADTLDLGSSAERHGGSTPPGPTVRIRKS